jgi:hypothetical protein
LVEVAVDPVEHRIKRGHQAAPNLLCKFFILFGKLAIVHAAGKRHNGRAEPKKRGVFVVQQ